MRARLQEAFSVTLAPRNHSDPFPCFPSPISHKTPTQCQVLAGGWGFRDKTYSLLSQIPQPSWREGRSVWERGGCSEIVWLREA